MNALATPQRTEKTGLSESLRTREEDGEMLECAAIAEEEARGGSPENGDRVRCGK